MFAGWPVQAMWPLLACSVAVFAGGGYSGGSRIAFAATALVSVVAVRPRVRTLHEPAIAALLALSVLGLASFAWTVGLAGETLAWAVVTAAYAGVAACAVEVARLENGVRALAAGLAVIAAVTAALGLASAALGDPAFAVDIAGAWRPAGPFEYPPALALLQVSVFPVLLAGIRSGSRSVAAAAGLGLALSIAVIAFSASRLSLALAIVVAGAALAHRRSVPRPALTAAVVVAVAAVAGALAFGPAAGRGAGPRSDFLHGRAQTWEAAIRTFADRPLHGAGADAFLAASARHQDGQTIAFAHNLPLEAAAELGVPGLLLVLGLYVAAARLLWRRRSAAVTTLLGPAVAVFLIANLLDWPWHLAGSGASWALSLGAVAGGAARARV